MREYLGSFANGRVKSCISHVCKMVFFVLCAQGLTGTVGAAPGYLDPSFDGDGGVLTNIGGSDGAFALVQQSDRKLVAAGFTFYNKQEDFALARYNPNGSLDTSFGSSGKGYLTLNYGGNERAHALLLQPDGKLVAVGFMTQKSNSDFLLVRRHRDGRPDRSFFGTGATNVFFGTNSNEEALAAIRQADGKLVAAGWSDVNGNKDFALVRVNRNGKLDTSFGGNGFVTTDFGGDDFITAMIVQPDGKLVVAGVSLDLDGKQRSHRALARYHPNGTLDGSFGSQGKVLGNFDSKSDDATFALLRLPNGELWVAGSTNAGGHQQSHVARYNSNGTWEKGWAFGPTGFNQEAQALVLQKNGKFIVGSTRKAMKGGVSYFTYHRLNADGSFDRSLSRLTWFGNKTDNQLSALLLQGDGKLVAAGTSNARGEYDFALFRLFTSNQPISKPQRCQGKNATIIGSPRNDNLSGTNGPDVIMGLGGNDTIRGLGGDDIICGGNGDDILIGGTGNDQMFGEQGADTLFGQDGDDRLDGGSQIDECDGGVGQNSFSGCEKRPAAPPPAPPPVAPPPRCIGKACG